MFNLFNGGISEFVKIASMKVGTASSTPLNGDAVDMSLYSKVEITLATGDMANETLDFKAQSSTVSAFNGTQADVVSATQRAASASANDSKIIVLEVKSADLASGQRYIRGVATTGNTTGGAVCISVRGVPRYLNVDDGTPVVTGEIDAVVERKFA